MSTDRTAYRGILKSAALLGSARAMTMAIGLVRVKFLALILGPFGVGLLGTFETIITTAIYLSGLGVSASGVREIALANAGGDRVRTARTISTLQRLSWGLGLIGMLGVAAFAWPISRLTFNDSRQGIAILILSPAILLTSVLGGLSAVIQGVHRIADLAKLMVVSTVVGTIVTVALVGLFGERGIAPSFVFSALVRLLVSEWYIRRLKLPRTRPTWGETLRGSGVFIRLGFALTNALLLSSLVDYATRTLIARDLGLEAVGIYLCAFGLSGKFVGFILDAMRTDFYPRLSAVAKDHESLNRLVNQQTEIVLLMAMPGMLATLAFAPWLVRLFYSGAFDQATPLLRWFILGCLGRVIGSPMAYVRLAKGRGLLYFLSEAGINAFNLLFIIIMLKAYALPGIALAYVGNNFFRTLVVVAISKRLTGFSWSAHTVQFLLLFVPIAVGCVLASFFLNRVQTALVVGAATAAISLYCLRQLAVRLGPDHRLLRLVARLPLLGGLLPRC
jgi:PST family polysaccharide transporter